MWLRAGEFILVTTFNINFSYINKYKSSKFEFQSIIRCAIEKVEDGQVLQIILDCLLDNINKDIDDPLTQRLYHPSYFISSDDILCVLKVISDLINALKKKGIYLRS